MRRETRRGKRGMVEGTLEKERRLAAGSWLAGVVEAGANEPFFTPVGRWVVERGLPRLLSVSRTSGLQRSFFFLPLSFVLFLPFAFSVLVSPFLLSLASVLFRAQLSQPFYFAISFPRQRFLFFPFRPICSTFPPPPYSPAPLANLAPVSPPFTRALFRLLLRSVPTACVSTAKSIDRNVFRSGRNERECNRREWGGI